MPVSIVIERKPNGRLAPVGGDRRGVKLNEEVTITRSAELDALDLRITFTGRSPFRTSDDPEHSFSYNQTQKVVRAHAAGGENIYKYKCHRNGQPPSDEDGGEIEIEPGG